MDFKTFAAPEGERLDVAIANKLGFSRTYAKGLIDEGHVQIDGKPYGKASKKLLGNELITVMLPPTKPSMVEAQDIPLDIIYEDSYLAAINKPANLVAHPTATLRTNTVVNALLGRMQLSKDNSFDPSDEDYRPGIVHRLDKDTSGIMVIAKTNEAHRHLANSFKKRLTVKEYIAISVGKIADDTILNAPIGRDPIDRKKMTIGGTNQRPAKTHFRVLEQTPKHSLIKARPHSGRTHQIRVHLKHLNAPILSDHVYGKKSKIIDRQALHAFRLTIPHPHDNQAITFSAQVPEDMVSAWLRLGGSWPPGGVDFL